MTLTLALKPLSSAPEAECMRTGGPDTDLEHVEDRDTFAWQNSDFEAKVLGAFTSTYIRYWIPPTKLTQNNF